ncbi:MAG: HEAT repeat domain-containing protein [Planctomycetota bacterium]
MNILADIPGTAALAALVKSVGDAEEIVRLIASAALIKRGSMAPLKRSLSCSQSAQISTTIRNFEKIARASSIQQLVKALDSPDMTVRSMARLLLANFGDGAEPALMALPEDLTPEEEKERIRAWKDWWERNKARFGVK